MHKKLLFILSCSFFINIGFAQQVSINYKGNSNYILTERTDLRRYDNGKYKGLVSREVKAYITPNSCDEGYKYEGFFYVQQDTKRASNIVFKGIHDAISSIFVVDKDGSFRMEKDCGYPSFRSFPMFPKKEIELNDQWTGTFERAVDPLEKNISTVMKSDVVYQFTGERIYRNEEVFVINAQWATRYNKFSENADLNGDLSLASASGKHNAEILVNKQTGIAVLIRDTVDESFRYDDGNVVAFKGTISMFTEYPPTINDDDNLKEEIIYPYEKTAAGIKISIFDLRFEANSAILLPGENIKLIDIANYLKKYPNNKILIEGHTARAGDISNEEALSLERTHSILDEFVKLGLEKEKFICIGSGGNKPIGDNSTEEGRAKNRRVEITILGDIK